MGKRRGEGEFLECLLDDCWWEAHVVRLLQGGASVQVLTKAMALKADEGPPEVNEARLDCCRNPLRYGSGGRWEAVQAEAPQLVGQVRAAAAAAEQQQQQQQPPQGRPQGRNRKPAKAAAVEDEEEELEPADDEPPPTKRRRGASAAAAAAAAAPAPVRPSAAAAGKKAQKAGGGGGGKAAQPAYEVPPGFDPAVLPPVDLSSEQAARRSLPLAFCRRFLVLRREVPVAGEPGGLLQPMRGEVLMSSCVPDDVVSVGAVSPFLLIHLPACPTAQLQSCRCTRRRAAT